MAGQGVIVMCYWNGKITSGPNGISYEGATPRPIRVNYDTTHNELLGKLYGLTGFDRQRFKMKIICRYPTCREFIPVPINDDESLNIVFDVVRQPKTNCIEIYLEREPLCIDNQVNTIAPVCSGNQANITVPVHTNDGVNVYDNQIPKDGPKHNTDPDNFLDPGPSDKSVLVLQDQHRSEAIWAGQDPGVLTCRQRLGTMMRDWQLDHRIRQFVIQSGFYGICRIGFIQLDWPLITALVERWRQETHTFHFAVGESTVTLQDVAVLLGLRIHGPPVTGSANLQWDDLCEELLGVRPDPSALHGSTIKLSWLRGYFQQIPTDADDVTLRCYARAYLLGLLGSLFADKSGSDVQLIFLPLLRDFSFTGQLSWASAVLAHLYRELCRASKKGASEISGPLMLLQLWTWERLHIGRPERFGVREQDPILPGDETVWNIAPLSAAATIPEDPLLVDPLGCRWRAPTIRRDNPKKALIFYRDQLDQQTFDQMIWQPYTSELLMSLPNVCVRDQHLWRTIAPLIFFDIVEWHRPDRVLRQFGLNQGIPVHCDTEVKIHAVDRRGRHHYNWKAYHQQYIKLWVACEKSIAVAAPEESPMHYHDPYMEWYRKITRRLITPITQTPHKRFQPTSGTTHLLVHSLTNIHHQCRETLAAFSTESARQSLADIQITCSGILQMIGEIRHLEARPATTPAPPTTAATPSPSQANDVEGPSQFIRENLFPPPASMPAKTTASRVRGQGRAQGRGRKLSKQQTVMEPLAASPQSLQLNDIDIEDQSTPNSEISFAPSVGLLDVPDTDCNERSLRVPQVKSNLATRPKKKPKLPLI